MGFLDKVKETAGKVGEQAKHATAVGKEKIDDVRLQKKIDSLCEEIGKLVVAQRNGTAPDDAATRIDTKVSEIAELQQQIDANAVEAAADGEGESTDTPS